MSSPFTFDEDNSSLKASEDDLNKFSTSVSYEFNSSFADKEKNEVAIDQAIAGLKTCLQQYEDKAKYCENQLDKLGFNVSDLPEKLRQDLKEVFKDDDGVFNFSQTSNELVTINADHVFDSLRENYELAQLRMLQSQMETLVEEHSRLNNNLQRKLITEKEESEKLENKRFEKEANIMMFNQRLEAAKWELNNLQQLSQGNQKPKYSVEELDNLRQEVQKLKIEIAHTEAKLKKYNKLPLSEKDALKLLTRMKDDIKIVDKEIENKVLV
ncbi:uncharacterized protein LOC128995265 [Macrosteles quadrilineatus]|uniref:uncharacterized protein LOC128995265 n=1 Tax=Macrosteles quadrilineatus TaxID=74068 RepID=UPI0023E12C8B|nr:uncharacterized protein LOC128995265 [Macrosteles quadrilineatus]